MTVYVVKEGSEPCKCSSIHALPTGRKSLPGEIVQCDKCLTFWVKRAGPPPHFSRITLWIDIFNPYWWADRKARHIQRKFFLENFVW